MTDTDIREEENGRQSDDQTGLTLGKQALRDVLPRSINSSSAATTAILLLLSLYTLHFAASLLVPLVFALLLDLMFQPFVDRLRGLGLPRGLGALIVLVGLCSALVAAVYSQTQPAMEWLDRAPTMAQEIRIKTEPLRKSAETLQSKTREMEEIATGLLNQQAPESREVILESQTWREQLMTAAERFFALTTVTLILLYFLLATGNSTARNLLYLLPNFGARRTAVHVGRQVRIQISRYLVTITCINITLGITTTLLMWALGMPNPWLWGLLAGIMNFIPYVGSTVTTLVIAIVAGISFDETWRIVIAPLSFFLLTSAEGHILAPALHGQRFSINPVLIFVSMTFWAMLWGAPGVILAVPLLVTFKVVCDQVEQLRPVSRFMAYTPAR